ncbi:hypothetical protein ACFX2H_013137 [Malus domestica]
MPTAATTAVAIVAAHSEMGTHGNASPCNHKPRSVPPCSMKPRLVAQKILARPKLNEPNLQLQLPRQQPKARSPKHCTGPSHIKTSLAPTCSISPVNAHDPTCSCSLTRSPTHSHGLPSSPS